MKHLSWVLIISLLAVPSFSETGSEELPFNEINASNVFDSTAEQAALSGRKGKTNAAQMAAMIGAGVAGAMCAYLMKKAQETPPGSERTMLMMQATQQCSQAAQNMANAGQNGEGADALTSPALAQSGFGPNPLSNTPTTTPTNSNTQRTPATTPNYRYGAPTPSTSEDDSEKTAQTSDDFTPSDSHLTLATAGKENAGPGKSALEPIPDQTLTYDEAAGIDLLGASNGRGAVIASNSGNIDFDKLNSLLDEKQQLAEEAGDRNVAESGEGSGGANGSAGGGDSQDLGSKKDDGDFDFSSFFGGGGGQVVTPGGAAAAGSLALDGQKGNKAPHINIFQYATYRYKRLAHQEGKVQTKMYLEKAKPNGQKSAALSDDLSEQAR